MYSYLKLWNGKVANCPHAIPQASPPTKPLTGIRSVRCKKNHVLRMELRVSIGSS